MPYTDKPAFRCRKCSHLEAAGHAGEEILPHACSVCGSGVTFNPAGIKKLQADNWEVLAEATPERLAELGLTLEGVEKHVPLARGESREPKAVCAFAQDSLRTYEELGFDVRNKRGQLVAEGIQKTDLNTSANLIADVGKPSRISVVRKKRVTTFEEEGAAAEALVDALNKKRGTNYHVEEKTKEDNDYPDRVFISENDNPTRICVQMRHLDTEIIAGVGKNGAFVADRTAPDIIASIRDAIDDKATVDSKMKAETVLQLIVPAPLGAGIRQAIEKNLFDLKEFKEIWISPFHEESFPLNRS
jgi:hypothetical protein